MEKVLQFNSHFRKKILLKLILTLSFFVLTNTSDAADIDLEKNLQQNLIKSKAPSKDIHERISKSAHNALRAIENNGDIDTYTGELIRDLDEAEAEDVATQNRLEEIEKKLNEIGSSSILSRHRRAVKEYKAKADELKKRAAGLKEAKKKKASSETIKQKTRDLIDSIDKNRPKREYNLKSTANRLPWRMIQPGEVLLLGDAAGIPGPASAVTSTTPPAADDLSSTIDVQITPEIQALANSLDKQPLKILRHVYNNYRFNPYYGSMKGSLDTYWEKEGNDYDLASLLIALLRASNVPARYVKAKIVVPIDRAKKWVGIDDPLAVLQYLSGAQPGITYYVQGGGISHIVLQHIFVEAYVPYSNYRGTGEDNSGQAWVPMDPSFKLQTVLREGEDMSVAVGADWKSFSDEYFNQFRNITPLQYFREKVDAYISQSQPGKTLDDLKRMTEIKTMQFDFLPNSLPYKVLEVTSRFAEIPQDQRHSMRFVIPDVLDYSTSLPEIAGKRITLSFEGATADDQAVITAYGTIFDTPPYLIRVKPVLRIAGAKAAEGDAVNAAVSLTFNVEHTEAGGKVNVFDHYVMTGSYNAVGITIGEVRPEYLTIGQVEESEEIYLAKMLHSLAMKYQNNLNQARQVIRDAMKMQARTYIIESFVSSNQRREVIYGGIPISFDLSGFMIDAKEMATAAVPIDGQNSQKKAIDFSMIHGHEASYQENAAFEDSMFWLNGLSAVKGIHILKALGIAIDQIEPHQTYVNDNLPATVVDDINNALNKGWKVVVPHETAGLPAVPYIKYDPNTGSAGYMIAAAAGGFASFISPNGHETDLTPIMNAFQQNNLRIRIEIFFPASPQIVAMGEAFVIGLRSIAEGPTGVQATTEKGLLIDTDRNHYFAGNWPLYAIQPGEYKIKFDGQDLFVYNVWGVLIDPGSSSYLGITTVNGVDTIPNPLVTIYSITDIPNVQLSSVAMVVYNSANEEVRRQSLPTSVGQGQTARWDGKDNGGQIVAPGVYRLAIEASGTGGTARSEINATVFKIEILEPANNSQHNITTVPAMPTTIGARVRIAGISPDPTPSTQFEWTAQIRFQAGDCDNGVDREINIDGGPWTVTGGQFTPTFDSIRGGSITLIMKAMVGGQTVENRTQGLVIRGTNPQRTDIREALPHNTLRRIACQESRQRQFNAAENGGISECPLFSTDLLGGVGIMQITKDPVPGPDDHWNWRTNVATGVQNFLNKVETARAYPGTVVANDSFRSLVLNFNTWRQQYDLAPVQVTLPNYTTGNLADDILRQLELDGIRGYNGWVRRTSDGSIWGQFGLPLHEYRVPVLTVQDVNGNDMQIPQVTVNEQSGTGIIEWEQVPVTDRPPAALAGDPNYVSNVNNQHILCGD